MTIIFIAGGARSGKELRKVLEVLGRWSHANLKVLHPAIVSID
jgi:hypothetical protein